MLIKSGNCPHCLSRMDLDPPASSIDTTVCPNCSSNIQLGDLSNQKWIDPGADKKELQCSICNTHMLVPANTQAGAITECPNCKTKLTISASEEMVVTKSDTDQTIIAVLGIITAAIIITAGISIPIALSSDSGKNDNINESIEKNNTGEVKGETIPPKEEPPKEAPKTEPLPSAVEEETTTPEAKPEPVPPPSPSPTPAPKPPPPPPPKTTPPKYTCNCSKTCPNISTCAEAFYLLDVCGCHQRDADNDGIPCDSMCQ